MEADIASASERIRASEFLRHIVETNLAKLRKGGASIFTREREYRLDQGSNSS